MAYSLACADTGVDCPGAFTTETQEELMEHIEIHGKHSHPDMELTDELREQLMARVKTS